MFIQGMEGGKLMEEVKTDTGIQKVGTGESKTVSEYKNIMLSTATKRKIGMLPPEPQKNKGTNAITL